MRRSRSVFNAPLVSKSCCVRLISVCTTNMRMYMPTATANGPSASVSVSQLSKVNKP